MKVELNKRIEANMLEILKIIDEMDASVNSHGGSKETLITLDDEE
jgi:hypothetical protein